MSRRPTLLALTLPIALPLIALPLSACEDDATSATARLTITPRGGQLNHGPITLTVPVGAVPEAVEVTLAIEQQVSGDGVVPGTVVSLQPEILRFAREVDLAIWFSPGALPTGANGDNTGLVRRQGDAWVRVAGVTDVRRWATGSIVELGTFAVRSTASPPNPDSGTADSADGGTGDTSTKSEGGIDLSADLPSADLPARDQVTSAPDSVTPDSVTPDSVTPDSVTPDSVTPDSVTPDSAGADSARLD